MSQTETRVARSVLFVDFDNMGLSIKKTDEVLANAFARAPQVWVDALERGELIDDDGLLAPRRRFLMKRCYANPRLIDPYRANFTWAGFQVVDCPPLTGGGKNSADIYMVMDILDALEHKTPFDEFFILSSDADFTPVLTRLTAYDRRTVIFANQVTAQAYKTMCDGLIPEPALMDLLAKTVEYARRERTRQAAPTPAYHPTPQATVPQAPLPQAAEPREPDEGERDDASVPVANAAPAPSQRPRVPPIPDRVRPMARAIAEETDVPYLAPIVYAEMFKAIADEVNEKGFSLNKTVKGVHERIEAATGWGIYPKYIAFVLKGIQFTGLDLASGEVTAVDLAKAFQRQVIRLAGRAGMELNEPDRKNVAWWMRSALPRVVATTDESAPTAPTDDANGEAHDAGQPIEDADALVDASETGDLDTIEAGQRDGADSADLDTDDEAHPEELGPEEMGSEELGPEELGPDEMENGVGTADHAAPLTDDDALVGDPPDTDANDSRTNENEGLDPEALNSETLEGDETHAEDQRAQSPTDDRDHADPTKPSLEPVEALDASDDDVAGSASDGTSADPELGSSDPVSATPPRRGWWQVSPAAPVSPLANPPVDPAKAAPDALVDSAERGPEPAVKPLVDSGDELDRILEQLRSIGSPAPVKPDGPA